MQWILQVTADHAGDNRVYVEDGGEIDDSDEYEDDELQTLASMTNEELRDLQKKIKVQKELNKRAEFAEVEVDNHGAVLTPRNDDSYIPDVGYGGFNEDFGGDYAKEEPGIEPSPGRERNAVVLAAAPKKKTKSVAKQVFSDILAFDFEPLMDQPVTALDEAKANVWVALSVIRVLRLPLPTSRMER